MDDTDNPPSLDSRQILIIEDEEPFLLMMAKYFARLGYQVHSAREREEAEALINHFEYALVITDLRLTQVGLAGLDVLREIAEHCAPPKVIVLTGHCTPDVEAEARRRGVDVFLRKPQRLRHLGSIAASLLSKSGSTRA
jgi:DNA-binding NtrC family response regulator